MSNGINILYGKTGMRVRLPDGCFTELRPRYPNPFNDEKRAFSEAVNAPICGGLPLRDRIRPADQLAVVIPDITRALPNERLLNWLLEELSFLKEDQITIISGTGTHRSNTPDEWISMVGKGIYSRFKCVDHVCDDPKSLRYVGKSSFDYPVHYNRHYVEADRRIILGFIEPHFMAGFSGGYKAVLPGIADLDSILNYHSPSNIANPNSTWGIMEGNPTQDHIRAGGSLLPVDFCINVTMNHQQGITGFFCGDTIAAHRAGTIFCKKTAMVPCTKPFPVVLTSNSGYPLDQNLYQCVKGISAASKIVKKGGLIIMAGACNDGLPGGGHFEHLLKSHESPQTLLEKINQPDFRCRDQWQVQILARILLKAEIWLRSELPASEVRKVHLTPISDLQSGVELAVSRLTESEQIAILPEGPMTIPYII